MRSVRSIAAALHATAGRSVLAAFLLLFAPVGALAQTYTASLEPMPYQPVPMYRGSVPQRFALDGNVATIPLPFSVEFFGKAYSIVNVFGTGLVTFGNLQTNTPASGEGSGRREIPGTGPSTPHNFVAVWWGETACGAAQAQVVGLPPDRHYVLEWTGCRHSSSPASRLNAQLWLPESFGDIEVRYGPIVDPDHVFRGAMGIENEDGMAGAPGLSLDGTVCNPDCGVSDFPTDHRIVYRVGSIVSMGFVRVEPNPITIGHPATLRSVVSNRTDRDLDDATVRYRIGPSRDSAAEIGMVTRLSIPAGTNLDVPLTIDTTELTPGTYYVVAELESSGETLPEAIGPAVGRPFLVKVTTAKLWVSGLQAPEWVEMGATFEAEWEVENRDLLDASDVTYVVYLSRIPISDESILSVETGSFSLASHERISLSRTLQVPKTTVGNYLLGVSIDPNEEIPHADRSGNSKLISISVGHPLQIMMLELPAGGVGKAYSAALYALGSVRPYEWSVASGALPPGLTIDGDRIAGVPTTAGIFPFIVEVRSGGSVAAASLFIEIGEALTPAVACAGPKDVAPMQVRVTIDPIRLSATGGEAPYLWSSVRGAVPGLAVSADGEVAGTPTEAGAWSWDFEVADVHGSRSTCRLPIEVVEAPGETELLITSRELPRARAGASYEARLEASGTSGTLTWSLGSEGSLPENLELSEDGVVRGVPAAEALGGEPSRTFAFEVSVEDSAGREARAVVSLEVYADRPPASSSPRKKGGGCQSTSGDASLLALGLALGLAALGRRRR